MVVAILFSMNCGIKINVYRTFSIQGMTCSGTVPVIRRASFDAMAEEISISRLYGGIHYRYSCEEGAKQGRKTAQNIDAKLKFLK